MKKIIFVIVFFAGCILFTSCKKNLPVNTYGSTPPPPPPIGYWLPPPPIPDSLGRVQFWTKVEAGDYPNYNAILTVSVNNETRNLTWAYGAEPDCLHLVDSNEGRFDLIPGIYTWKAKYLTDSISGTIIINRSTCVLQEIKF